VQLYGCAAAFLWGSGSIQKYKKSKFVFLKSTQNSAAFDAWQGWVLNKLFSPL
jgi:hypothetical protein